MRVVIGDHAAAEDDFALPDIALQFFRKIWQAIHYGRYGLFSAHGATARRFRNFHPGRFARGRRSVGVFFSPCRAAKRHKKQKRPQGKI